MQSPVLRQVVLDTETTGLTVEDGHRIIEVGCIEIVNRRISGRTLHFYLNPERDIDEGALAVHGLSRERLRDEPKFAEVADRFLDFVAGAEILIHNASFDVGFLDAELARIRRPAFSNHVVSVIDTLAMGRRLHPGKRNSLDSLCDRYGISNAHRKLHGALLDAELLADVYLAMTRGQDSLDMSDESMSGHSDGDGGPTQLPAHLRIVRADADALASHQAYLAAIAKDAKAGAIWTRLQPTDAKPA